MRWTVDWFPEKHPKDYSRFHVSERPKLLITEVKDNERFGELIEFWWYKTIYASDPSDPIQIDDERLHFHKNMPLIFPDGSDVKLRFSIPDKYIEEISIYRGRRKTHKIDDRHGIVFLRLRFLGKEAISGCLSSKCEWDKRGYNPTISIPWRIFKLIVLGDFNDKFYKGEVDALVEEI